MTPNIGQFWQRKNGVIIEITARRMVRGSQEFLLTPIQKGSGRESWKWDAAISHELTFLR